MDKVIRYATRQTLVVLKEGLLKAATIENRDGGPTPARDELQEMFNRVATEIERIDKMNRRKV
jgi:hypothetical protein